MTDYLYHYVEIYETLLLNNLPEKIIADNFLIESFSEARNYHITHIDITPQPMLKLTENEVQIQGNVKLSDIKKLPEDPVGRSKYIAIWARFPAINGNLDAGWFHDEVAKAITLLSVFNRADQIFAKKVLSGFYVEPDTYQYPPIKIKGAFTIGYKGGPKSEVESSATELAKLDRGMKVKFKLMSRLYAKALSEYSSEEKLLWLWTALEIFPMLGSHDATKITKFIAEMLSKTTQEIGNKLNPAGIYSIRSNLVHHGEMKIDDDAAQELIEKLRLIVEVTLRSLCNATYDGRLDHYL